MQTPEKILDTARRMFNEKGVKAVTVRHIAAEMGISHGNLCYHFPSTTDIVRALYRELAGRFSQAITGLNPANGYMRYIRQQTAAIASTMYDYRFFFIDFVSILRNDEWIRKHYRQLMEERVKQFEGIFFLLIKEGLLEPEKYPGHYRQLIEVLFLNGDFWLSRAAVKGIKGREKQLEYFIALSYAPLAASFTEKGLKEYLAG